MPLKKAPEEMRAPEGVAHRIAGVVLEVPEATAASTEYLSSFLL